MNTSHLGRAVAFICRERDTTQTEIATNAGLSQVVLSRACNGTRPEVKTLRALCTSQPDHRDNIDLLVAHLRDEIERAGHSTHEIEINADSSRLDDDLRLLLEEAKHDPQLAAVLRQLATFVRSHPAQPEEEALAFVAEEQAPYDAKPRDPAGDALEARAAQPARRPTDPAPQPPARAKGKA